MPNETAKVKGQPIPYKDMHGCAYGMSDRVRPHPLGQTQGNQYNPKMSPKPIQACRSFPNIALFQTHIHTRTHPHTPTQNQIKEHKGNRTNPQKRTKSDTINNTRVWLCSTKSYASMLLDVFQLRLNFASNKMNTENRIGTGSVFRGNVQSKCVWWCTSLPGAQVSQWTGSCGGWVNEGSPQEDVSVHLWVPTPSGQMLNTRGCGCPVKFEL